jgi:hypothetical protein
MHHTYIHVYIFVCVCVCVYVRVCVCVSVYIYMHACIHIRLASDGKRRDKYTCTLKTQFSRHSIREQHRLPAVHTHTHQTTLLIYYAVFLTKLLY